MKVTVIGGGPGGLYFSILLKKAIPHSTVDIYERNKADDAFGFGVVFSDETLGEFLTRDPQSYELIRSRFAYWDDLDVARCGEKVRITGNGFCGCSRKTLLQLLQQRCMEEGVGLHFESNVDDLTQFKDSDVIVACDGINSGIRQKFAADFGTKIELRKNRFVWMGTTKPLDAFTYFFRTTSYGAFVAHSYQYEKGMSTLVFETSEDTWQKAGFEVTDEADTIDKLSEFFKEELDGHPLISNKSHWRQFPVITNERWFKDNIVLLGDAKATAHFSIGSGTKLAMECAIGLADAIIENQHDIQQAFKQYEKKRRPRVERIQLAAHVSLEWFENMDRHISQDFMQFAFGVMTRSGKVTFDNLALRDPSFPEKVLHEFNKKLGNVDLNTPAAFTPFSLQGIKLTNRIVMAPVELYSAKDGLVSDWHLVHYGARAIGGVGLILTEMTAVSDNSAITAGSPGIYTEEQTAAWQKITDFIHRHSQARIGIQLEHSDNTKDFANAVQNAHKAGFDIIVVKEPGTGKFKNTKGDIINIYEDRAGDLRNIDQINTVLLNGRADLIALGRPLLLDPNFVRNAQAYEQFPAQDIPEQYQSGISHLYPLKLSERKSIEGMRKALKPGSHKQ